jgi:hypothetical protein
MPPVSDSIEGDASMDGAESPPPQQPTSNPSSAIGFGDSNAFGLANQSRVDQERKRDFEKCANYMNGQLCHCQAVHAEGGSHSDGIEGSCSKCINTLKFRTTIFDSLRSRVHELEESLASALELCSAKISENNTLRQQAERQQEELDSLSRAKRKSEKALQLLEHRLPDLESRLAEEIDFRKQVSEIEKHASDLRQQLSDKDALLQDLQDQIALSNQTHEYLCNVHEERVAVLEQQVTEALSARKKHEQEYQTSLSQIYRLDQELCLLRQSHDSTMGNVGALSKQLLEECQRDHSSKPRHNRPVNPSQDNPEPPTLSRQISPFSDSSAVSGLSKGFATSKDLHARIQEQDLLLSQLQRQTFAAHSAPTVGFKLVAKDSGRYFSLFAGPQIEYELGIASEDGAQPSYRSGLYFCSSVAAALRVQVPSNNESDYTSTMERVILKCQCEGPFVAYSNCDYACSRLTPIEEVLAPPVLSMTRSASMPQHLGIAAQHFDARNSHDAQPLPAGHGIGVARFLRDAELAASGTLKQPWRIDKENEKTLLNAWHLVDQDQR